MELGTTATNPPQTESGQQTWAAGVFLSPMLWGVLLTVGFYSLIPHLPVQRELAIRYFCGHPLEYATAALFFLGVAVLALKCLRSLTEKRALEQKVLDPEKLADFPDAVTKADVIEEELRPLPGGLQQTHLIRRIRDVCSFIRIRRCSDGLEEHLKYLAELAAERLHESFGLVRTITWAVPILGFLGTVMGITIAIANLDFKAYESSMAGVIGGLAVAFDTTTLALLLSLILVFFRFFTERGDQQVLSQVEDFALKQFPSLFPRNPTAQTAGGVLAAAEAQAAKKLLNETESLISSQTLLWQQGLETLRKRWSETLDAQQQDLSRSLKLGMADTLSDHSDQLAKLRREFLLAFEEASHRLTEGQTEALGAQRQLQDSLATRMEGLCSQLGSDLESFGLQQAERADEMAIAVSEKVDGWQNQLQNVTETTASQLEQLRAQGEILLQIVQQEEQLGRLQGRLAENLETLRAAETFEETLHSLSAAVHLLTARVKPKAA